MTQHDDGISIPTGRFSRFMRMGALASGVAGNMLAEGARQLAQGNRPKTRDLLLTPANAKRLTDELARLRGAAMKVGQLLSMDTGDVLPAELTEMLARLRADAKPMPLSQLAAVLDQNWGKEWQTRFKQFSFQPLAAASIGQVHSAHTKDGRHVALKIQYAGVRDSIGSDVDNVATLLKLSGLIPKNVNYQPIMEDAKLQLQQEADYLQEAEHLRNYQHLLTGETDYLLPEVYDDLTTINILAMSYVGGVPIESLEHAPQAERDHAMTLLMRLLFKEIFDFHLVQTDPNFANFRYDRQTKQLILLDFGATRAYSVEIASHYRHLMQGALIQNRAQMDAAAAAIGFFQNDIAPAQRNAVLNLFVQGCEPLCYDGVYDFGNSDLPRRIRDAGMHLSFEQGYWHTPPADALFLHRKLGGLYLLAAKLRARINVHALFAPYCG